MFVQYWSLDGRISRGGFWLGILAVNTFMFAAFALLVSLPALESWMVLVLMPLLVLIAAAMYTLQVKRLHDLGQSASVLWSPFEGFRWVWAMGFAAGDKEANKYGPPPTPNRVASWLGVAILVGGLSIAVGLFFTSGFECKAMVSASGSNEEEAKARWRHEVERLYGPRISNSGITILSVSTCMNGDCNVSARPCAFAE